MIRAPVLELGGSFWLEAMGETETEVDLHISTPNVHLLEQAIQLAFKKLGGPQTQ